MPRMPPRPPRPPPPPPPPGAPPPPPAGAPLAAGSSVQVPEKSGFCAHANVATARIAAAITPTRATFIVCSFGDCNRLLVPQRFDWVKPCSFSRRVEAEKDTRRRCKAERHADGIRRNRSRPLEETLQRRGQTEPERDAQQSAEEADDDRPDEELEQPVLAASPDPQAPPDPRGRFGCRHQPECHYP